MPHVVGVCIFDGRKNPAAGATQAVRQIIVFATPADEAFVETIDRLEIIPPNSEVIRNELGLFGMAN